MSLGRPIPTVRISSAQRLADRSSPCSLGHLAGAVSAVVINDLLPLPYTREALDHVSTRVEQVQDALGRKLLVENISTYLGFAEATLPEWEFVAEVARRSGCALLLDVNNIFVNAVNHGFDADRYLAAIPGDAVAEIHLAGFDASGPCLIDTHGAPVAPAVWGLFTRAIARFGHGRRSSMGHQISRIRSAARRLQAQSIIGGTGVAR
jgi:uncharacterized protein (UPF0276 family)